jgi:hypothetical protein
MEMVPIDQPPLAMWLPPRIVVALLWNASFYESGYNARRLFLITTTTTTTTTTKTTTTSIKRLGRGGSNIFWPIVVLLYPHGFGFGWNYSRHGLF